MSDIPSRETRGISQIDRDAAKGYFERVMKDAEVRRWIFFCRSDKKIIDIHHAHGSWPASYNIYDKTEMKKKANVQLKHNGKWLEFSLVQICRKDFVEKYKAKAEEILLKKETRNPDESLRDITLNELAIFIIISSYKSF